MMATIAEITLLMKGLSEAGLEEVRTFVEFLTRKELETHPAGWSFDFLDNFRDATVSAARDASGMEVKVDDATCAGVTRPALWQHPPVSGWGSVGYLVPVPQGLHHVKLLFGIGIRDGSELPPDRFVAFRILVNGWKLWSAVKSSQAWEEHEIEMPQLGSNVARVEFVTDGLGQHQWDWAVWGMPRLEGERGTSG